MKIAWATAFTLISHPLFTQKNEKTKNIKNSDKEFVSCDDIPCFLYIKIKKIITPSPKIADTRNAILPHGIGIEYVSQSGKK